MNSITIIGKRWFNRSQGNTYFSAIGLVDGIAAVSIDYEYGYGNQFEDSTFKKLEEKGLLPGREHYKNGAAEAPWRYCKRNGISYSVNVSDVGRKKDL